MTLALYRMWHELRVVLHNRENTLITQAVREFAREENGENIEPRLRFILPDKYFAPQRAPGSGSGISGLDEHDSQSEADSAEDPK